MRTRASSSALFAVGSTLLLIVVIASVAVSVILSRLQSAHETLQALEPRYARLLGLEGEHERLQQALTQTSALLEGAAYPAGLGVGRVGADLQQKLRAASENAGFAVVSSRITAANPLEGIDEIPLSLRLEGSLASLEAMLRALPALRPAVHLRSLSVSSVARRGSPEYELRVDMVVAAARLAS
jgi:general secretion pathway protein M